jgi:hypothetical protein
MTHCCNIVYNSEVIINEFHANNYAFILDNIPVSFLLSKFNTACLQKSLGASPEDYARFNDIEAFKEAHNDVRNMALFIKSLELPGVSITEQSLPLSSITDQKFAGGKLVFDTLTTTLQVDENFFIPRFFQYWLIAAANPEKTMINNQSQYNKNFYPDGHLILLDNNRDKTIEIKFNNVHPKSISSIKLGNEGPDKAFITVQWLYSGYVFADEYKTLYERV